MKPGQPFNPYGKYRGLFLPNNIAKNPEVSDSAKLLLGRLFQFAGEDGQAFPSRDRLAFELGWNIRKLDYVIKALKDIELISTHQTDERSPSVYEFLYHNMYDNNTKYVKRATDKKSRGGTAKKSRGGTARSGEHKEINKLKSSIKKKNFSKEKSQTGFTSEMFNGLYCPICKCKQYETPSGVTCKNGHGGEDGIKKRRKRKKIAKDKTVAKSKKEQKRTSLAKDKCSNAKSKKEQYTSNELIVDTSITEDEKKKKYLEMFNYSDDAKEILSYWQDAGGYMFKRSIATKGPKQNQQCIDALLCEGLNPYSRTIKTKKEYNLKIKKWTTKEIISIIKYWADTLNRDISKEPFHLFVINGFAGRSSGLKDQSLFIESYRLLENGNGIMSPLAERLKKELSPLRPKENISDKACIVAADNLENYFKTYKLFTCLNFTYKHDPVNAFINYVKEKTNSSTFKLNHISGDFVSGQFVIDMKKRNIFEKIKRT